MIVQAAVHFFYFVYIAIAAVINVNGFVWCALPVKGNFPGVMKSAMHFQAAQAAINKGFSRRVGFKA